VPSEEQKEKEPAGIESAGFLHVFAQGLLEPARNPALSFQTASSCC
jgi:hypothetical protein